MKARLKSAPLWLRIALVIYVVVIGWLVIARVLGNEQQIVLKEPLELIDRPTLGRADAPVSIVIFSDFQCSYCRDFDREVLPRLEREFVETGKAKITFLHYPFMNENSHKAALAAECVYQLNPQAFWAYKSAIFALRQPYGEWATSESLLQMAEEINLGLSVSKLKTCFNSSRSKVQPKRDRTLAELLELTHVPTVLINQESTPATYAAIATIISNVSQP